MRALWALLRHYSLYLAWLLSCAAMLGSLYYSDIRHIEPCVLCWYQRICIYPLAVILGMATFTGNRTVVPYSMPLALLGIIVAGYQVLIQEVPAWKIINPCGNGPDCGEIIPIGLGPITIPMLSLLAFIAVVFLLIVGWPRRPKPAQTAEDAKSALPAAA